MEQNIATMPALILSLSFFTTFAVHVVFGVTSLFANSKSSVNRAVFVLCAFLAVWAFGFSISASAPEMNTALFWRRVAAFGWSGMFSALLYFFIVLTRTSNRLVTRWIVIPIFVPAVILMLVYGVFPGMVNARLVYTDLGWVNTWETGVWDWFYYAYYIGFSIASIVLLWRWGRRSGDAQEVRQAHRLIASLVAIFLIGTVTDTILTTIRPGILPQLTVIYTLLPVAVIYHATKRYGVFLPTEDSSESSATRIMDPVNREQIFGYLSLVFLFGSFLHFVTQYFFRYAPLASTFLFSTVLFGIGLSIWVAQRLSVEAVRKDTVSSLLVSAAIVLVIFRFLSVSSKTVWAVPFLFVLLSVAANRRRMLVIVSMVAVLSLVVVWFRNPVNEVRIDGVDHLVRIVLLTTTVGMAFYINQIYRSRLIENADQIAFRTTNVRISNASAKINESNFDQQIETILSSAGDYLHADSGYLVRLSRESRLIETHHEWYRAETVSRIEFAQDSPPDENPAVIPEGFSHLSAPVTRDGLVTGFLGFVRSDSDLSANDKKYQMLHIVANLVSDALERVALQEENRYMAFFDQLTDLPNRTLFYNRLDQAIKLARRNESLIGVVFLDLDGFKPINDSLGHDAGDQVLRRVAQRLTHQIRDHDTVSRFGGDEFLIMLTNIEKRADIVRIVEKVLQSFETPIEVKNHRFCVGISAGVSIFPAHGETSETLVKHADDAMYRSKNEGKNRYTLLN